jgi:SAM-dependent methyltransferase
MQCRICHNAKDNRAYQPLEMMFGTREAFDYFECSACGCLQIGEYPADIAKHYPPNYYSYSNETTGNTLFERFKRRLRDRYEITGKGYLGRRFSWSSRNSLLHLLAPVLQDRNHRILEVGCGAGALLRELHAIGFKRLHGADPFIEKDIRVDRRLVIQKNELSRVEGRFDLVMFHHSLEHMPNQPRVFADIAARLVDGGRCVIRVPLSSSYAWKHYRTHWVQLDAPRHFYLHSIRSLELLASRVGMRLDRTVYDATSLQFWGSEQYARDIPLLDPRSYAQSKNGESVVFTRDEIKDFQRRTREMNASGEADQAALFFTKTG